MRGLLRRLRPGWAQARPVLIVVLVLIFVSMFFFWRLGSMTPGLGPGEYASRQSNQDAEQIITRGVNAPYNLTQYAFLELLNNELWGLRLASVVFGLAITVFLFLLLRSWFGQTIALFASLIFITTPWLIIAARTGTPNIMHLWLIVLLASFVLMSRSKQRASLWWLIFCFTAALSLYSPGYAWFLIAGLIFGGKALLEVSRRIKAAYLIAGLTVAVLLLLPLVLSLILEPSHLRQLFLVPDEWLPGLEIIKSIGWSAAALFWGTKDTVDIGIDRLAILNILQIVLLIFGFYALTSKARKIIYALAGLLIFAILAAGVNDNVHLVLLGLPAVAVLIGAGLRYLFIEWRRVFPLNPFAYGLAIGLITIVVGTHLLYAARYSLIAWPETPETKSSFVLK